MPALFDKTVRMYIQNDKSPVYISKDVIIANVFVLPLCTALHYAIVNSGEL